MSWTAEENRKSIRIPYVRPVSYTALGQFRHASNEVTVQGMILDLGDGGVRILTEVRPFWEETVIRAWIPLPEPPIGVPVLAQVRWVREERREVYEIGLEFVLRDGRP